MSRTRIVKGTYTKISAGGHSMFAKESIISSAGKIITEQGDDAGLFYTKPKSPAKTERIIDIIMFVAGTTDPVNITGEKHQANTNYWRNKNKKDQDSKVNFWAKVKDLKPQYLDLHIEGNFFSWSGDNNTEERNIAAARLLDLFLRVYKFWKNQEVNLHLIGHSHGGNVINQFTELISKDAKYPKTWKVKSITYLSTPFFQKKHQLNHSKLHKDCKIINVYNEYDLTQQLIADFSLVNLEGLLKSFEMKKFDKGIATMKSVKADLITSYLKGWYSEKKAILAWGEMSKAFLGLNQITVEVISYIQSIKPNNAGLRKEKDTFIALLKSFQTWTANVHRNYATSGANKKYDKITWTKNLNLTQGITVLNTLFHIESGVKDSYLLTLLAKIFAEKNGITHTIDKTSWSPDKQTKGLTIIPVKLTEIDPYHSRGKLAICKKFIKGAATASRNNNLEEVLMRLFSQFVTPESLMTIINILNAAEYVVTGNLDTQVKRLGRNMIVYQRLVNQFHANLVAERDKSIKLMERPGTIPYLATTSHSLSHTRFWPKVETALREALGSGKKPGYKNK